jgi:DNA-binding transcriptional ArsR family regulator
MECWIVMGVEHTTPKHREHVPDAVLKRAASMLKAAGSPERLRLLECLREGEFCVTGLAEHLGEAVTTTSNRLQLLAREGLVTRRREERHQYYRLADAHVVELLDLALVHAGHVAGEQGRSSTSARTVSKGKRKEKGELP